MIQGWGSEPVVGLGLNHCSDRTLPRPRETEWTVPRVFGELL